jgi:hypothetical protein
MTAHELYDRQVKLLPLREKLELVRWILDDISEATETQEALPDGNTSSVLVEYHFDGKTPYEHLLEIAALPSEGIDDGFSGADHDKILYGENGAA